MLRQYKGDYIGGHFTKVADPNGEVWSINPGNTALEKELVPFSFNHIKEACQSAKRAYVSWRRLKASDRFEILIRFREEMKKKATHLSEMISFETGKPLWESQEEISETLLLIDYFINQGSQTTVNLNVPDVGDQKKGIIRFFSRGVSVVIAPAYSPVLSSMQYIIPNLMHGNTVIFISSRYVPFVAQTLAELTHEAAVPAGVLNIVHGNAESARRLVCDPEVDCIFFSGTYETGVKIQKEILNDYWKTLYLETAGKNATVVWKDAPYEKALNDSVYSAFITSGQRNTNSRSILIHDSIFDRFLKDFHQIAKRCQVGYAFEEPSSPTFMGPLITEASMEDYLRYQGIAVREGAEEIMRGKALERKQRGFYVSPSIHHVQQFDPKSVYQKNEFYGPNVALYRVKDIEEADQIINHSEHNLVVSIYTESKNILDGFVGEVDSGIIHWNFRTTSLNYRMPIGGVKKSGNYTWMGSHSGYSSTFLVSLIESSTEADSFPKAFSDCISKNE